MSEYKFTEGQQVRVLPNTPRGTQFEIKLTVGDVYTVVRARPCSSGCIRIRAKDGEEGERFESWFEAVPPSEAKAMTKAEREIMRAEAALRALKDRAAKKARDAAEKKAKAEREKLLKGLSPAGRRVIELLKAKPELLGCQTKNAAELAAAITGDDADKIHKALS